MTVATTDTVAGPFNGNDVTTAFPFTSIKALANSEIVVIHTDATGLEATLVETTDYTLVLNADQDASPGGTVTYPVSGSPLATGEKLTIQRFGTYLQNTDLVNQGAWLPEVIELDLDRIVMRLQELKENIGRAVLVDVSSGITPDTLLTSINTSESNSAASAAAALASETAAAASSSSASSSAASIAAGNFVVNGGCRVAQRLDGDATVNGAYQQFAVDNIGYITSSVNITSGTLKQAVTSLLGSTGFAAHVSNIVSSSAAGFSVVAAIEAADTKPLSGDNVTYSVKVYHDYGADVQFKLEVNTPNTEDDFSAVTNQLTTGDVLVATGTEHKLEVSGIISDMSKGVELNVSVATTTGVTFSNDNVYIADFKAELGAYSELSPSLSYQHDLSLCKRYYEAHRKALASGDYFSVHGHVVTADIARYLFRYDIEKFRLPDISYSGASSFRLVANIDLVCSSVVTADKTDRHVRITATTTGSLLTVGHVAYLSSDPSDAASIVIDASILQ